MPTPSAAGIAYIHSGHVLLLRRSERAANHPNTWGFPGGGIEEGETPEQAAARESLEETGHAPESTLRFLSEADGFRCYRVDGERFTPALNDEHTLYAWAPLSALPTPLHPGIAETLGLTGQDEMLRDVNGWAIRPNTPISKVGIFPYRGRTIGAPDPDRIYMVLRPEEELNNTATIQSAKLLPIINEHTMLGADFQAAEEKGVEGIVADDVYYADGYLRATTKIFSSSMDELIQSGKRELSFGYRCKYELTPGVWQGQAYDAIQRTIRGNHVALVHDGRMGPDVAMFDHFTVTFDAEEYKMPDPTKDEAPAKKSMTLDELIAVVSEIVPQIAKINEAMAALVAPPAAPVADEAAPAAAEAEEVAPPLTAEDAADLRAQVATLKAEITQLRAGGFKAITGELGRREKLAGALSHHIGTFDHSEMSLAEVAKYGVEKLGIPAMDGQEIGAVEAYLHARPAPQFGTDASDPKAAGGASVVGAHIARNGTHKE